MDNKKLGYILIGVAIIISAILLIIKFQIDKAYQSQILFYESTGQQCPTEEALCPHAQQARASIPIYIGFAIVIGVLSLAAYLIFFERSQKEIIETLKETKKKESEEERWNLLLSALNEDEKKVMNAVKEQDGISQATLCLRTDMSKTKLSFILKDLEEKGLIKRIPKGRINLVYLKRKI